MDGWNTIVSYWDGLFSGAFAVSFREGKVLMERSEYLDALREVSVDLGFFQH